MSCGCKTEKCGCDHGLHGYFLEGLTPDQALDQVFHGAESGSWAGMIREGTRGDIAAGQLLNAQGSPAYIPGTEQCAKASEQPGGDLRLAQTASGLALTGASIGLVAAGTVTAAALAPFTMGISALIGLFPLLFGHHSKAVQKEQSVLCSAVPAANNYLRIIDEAVKTGKVTPQEGIHALDSLLGDFHSQVSSIMKGSDASSGTCNAACVMVSQLHAIVVYKKSEYQDLIDGAAQQVTPARPNTTSPAGVSVPASSYASFYGQPNAVVISSSNDWLPIAALLFAGFLLMRNA